MLGSISALLLGSQARAGTPVAATESLMRSSGVWEQLAAIAPEMRRSMLAGLAHAGRPPSESELARLGIAIEAAYSVHRLRAATLAGLSRDLDPHQVATLSRYYESPQGRNVVRLELAQLHRDPQAIVDEAGSLLGSMPSARRRVLNEIVLTTRSAEWLTELNIETALASRQGAASMWPNASRPSASQLKAVLEAQRPQMIRTYSALSLARFAVAYSALTSGEIEQYLDFLKSDAAREFSTVGRRALSDVLIEAAHELGRTAPGTRDKSNT